MSWCTYLHNKLHGSNKERHEFHYEVFFLLFHLIGAKFLATEYRLSFIEACQEICLK